MDEIDLKWEQMKHEYPVGYKFYGNVLKIKPFGIFVSMGYPILDDYSFTGIVDIATKSDNDSSGLPLDNSLWPRVEQKIYCKVIAYRESSKEVCLRLVKE
jgi:predicted RNA-binding protein with RPS1 domain